MKPRYDVVEPCWAKMPRFGVTKEIEFGSDGVAFFWRKRDAVEYANWKNRKKKGTK